MSQFKKGDKVRYIPSHAKDSSDVDCENGVVSSVRVGIVFVKYGSPIETGEEPYTAQATYPQDLKLQSELKIMGKVYK